jgi:tRNA dihydrouridine synthase A
MVLLVPPAAVSHARRAPVAALHALHAPAAAAHYHDGPFAVAPMMDYTHQFLRFLLRRISGRATLYTEMVTANTLVHCSETELPRFLDHDGKAEQPLVLQIGGAEPEMLRRAAEIAEPWGFTALNLNCGCPSDRVAGSGCFGAALMRDPQLVARCCAALADGTSGRLPVTVKCRIGVTNDRMAAAKVDDEETYAELAQFIDTVSSQGGVHSFVIHARKAVLGGLSPAQNRQIPPLRYGLVTRLAADFPHAHFSLNVRRPRHAHRALHRTRALRHSPPQLSCTPRRSCCSSSPSAALLLLRHCSCCSAPPSLLLHLSTALLASPPPIPSPPPVSSAHLLRPSPPPISSVSPPIPPPPQGGIDSVQDATSHLTADSRLSGVMSGRAVIARPWEFATVDTALYGAPSDAASCRREVLHAYADYCARTEAHIPQKVRHLLLGAAVNLFANEPSTPRRAASRPTHHATTYHTIPYHTIPYHTIPYHTTPYRTIPHAPTEPPCAVRASLAIAQTARSFAAPSTRTAMPSAARARRQACCSLQRTRRCCLRPSTRRPASRGTTRRVSTGRRPRWRRHCRRRCRRARPLTPRDRQWRWRDAGDGLRVPQGARSCMCAVLCPKKKVS